MGYEERRNKAVNQLLDDLNRLQARIAELERQLADAVNGKLPPHQQLDPGLLWVESQVSSQTLEPMVVLRWFTHYAQLAPDEVLAVARNLLQAAEASSSESYLVRFLRHKFNLTLEQAAVALSEFRRFREEGPAEKEKE